MSRDFAALAEAVPGRCFVEALDRIYEEAKVSAGDVVEFGTGQGRTAIALSWGVEDRAEDHESHVHTFDPAKDDAAAYEAEKETYENLLEHHAARVCVHACKSSEVASSLFTHVGLVFIDGTEECRQSDLEWALRVLRDGGVLIEAIDFAAGEFVSTRLAPKWGISRGPESAASVMAFEVAPA